MSHPRRPAIRTVALAVITLLAAFAAGYALHRPAPPAITDTPPADQTARRVLYWYDPMVPGQRFDKPGKSPFMDMPLTARYADDAGSNNREAGDNADGVRVSARQQQNLGVKLASVETRLWQPQLDAFGTVSIDDRAIRLIPARAGGLVEKLYVRAEQQSVQKNQLLAQLWIPEWSAAQQEYLALRHLGDAGVSAAARQRLQLLYMPEDIIRSIEKTGQPQTRIQIRAPESGFINKLAVREGSQVTVAQPLFELATLDPLWVVVDYPESQADALQIGSRILATSPRWPGEQFSGRIGEKLPLLDNTSRTYRARIALQNHDQRLQPGMYLNIKLAQADSGQRVLAIPQDALIQTGSSNTVLLARGDGYFKPVPVETGRQFGDWVEIRRGLQAGDQVVTAGQFLIDSEASLRSALPQLAGDAPDTTKAAGTAPAAAPAGNAMTPAHRPAMDPAMSMPADEPAAPAPAGAATYSAVGSVDAVQGEQATLSHGAIKALGWPPMTMDFILPDGRLPAGISIGQRVQFHFTLDDHGARITHLQPAEAGQ